MSPDAKEYKKISVNKIIHFENKTCTQGMEKNQCISAKIEPSRMKQPAFVKLLQDSSHNYTNMNTIIGILKCVFHFSVKMYIICYCV